MPEQVLELAKKDSLALTITDDVRFETVVPRRGMAETRYLLRRDYDT